jgi:cytochrome c-type biogenesis protein
MYIEPQSVTIPFALLAGLFSFISPCVLPLVPAYIGYLTAQAAASASSQMAPTAAGIDGNTATPVTSSPARWLVVLHGLFFVIGFSIVFILIGISAGAIGQLSRALIINRDWITRIGGLLIIVLGLHTLGVIRIPFLYYDTRKQQMPRQDLGLLGSAIMGFTFAAGWSPCIGPFLAAMWTLGSATGSVAQAMVLLAFYAAGLGIPFLLTAIMIDRASGGLRKMQKHMRKVEIASGALLIVLGLILFGGFIQILSQPLANLTDVTIAIDEWLVGLAGGQ